MKKGRLNNRITIQRFTTTQDENNEDIEAWADLAKRWAAVIYGKGEERRGAAVEAGKQSASFVMLPDSVTKNITLKDRIFFKGSAWDIVGISPINRSEIEFTAVRAL